MMPLAMPDCNLSPSPLKEIKNILDMEKRFLKKRPRKKKVPPTMSRKKSPFRGPGVGMHGTCNLRSLHNLANADRQQCISLLFKDFFKSSGLVVASSSLGYLHKEDCSSTKPPPLKPFR
ncbi:hypothetical protein TNCT_325601 [Trichonephila clavata]|uniref:Uncharacterized protein n=1 Tax=Trichonephila clavata TaxID=2740835 RepID=A0A8X6H7X1_TRICU|nr:hypothetical protein TNCT_325601 [Trichonephila clavata]